MPDFSWSHATSGDKSDEGYSIVTVQVRRTRQDVSLTAQGICWSVLLQVRYLNAITVSDLQALNLHTGHHHVPKNALPLIGGRASIVSSSATDFLGSDGAWLLMQATGHHTGKALEFPGREAVRDASSFSH